MWFMCEYGNDRETSHAICEVVGDTKEIEARLEEVIDYITSKILYQEAYQIAESWVGSQGFCEPDESEEMGADAEHEEIENSLEYFAKVYDPDEDDGYMCGNQTKWKVDHTVDLKEVK